MTRTMAGTVNGTETNRAWVARCERAWQELLGEALQRGFFGSVSLEVQLQDGTIQNLRRRLERSER
ncbi:MAG: hypothetical protein K1X74_00595 [Pirellulales bacterium]|nr:hypothetical protein [Pirellulales bacterium]